MILKKLYINRGYGNDGVLRGEIEFKTDGDSEIKLKLDEQLSQEIVSLCASAVARAGQEAAKGALSPPIIACQVRENGAFRHKTASNRCAVTPRNRQKVYSRDANTLNHWPLARR